MNQPQKIVIVDDDEMTLELMRTGLEARHFTVYTAVDSMDAIKKIQESKPDLILLDIMLRIFPELNCLA
jgi:DNA-binding response OmpR family regulator